MLKEMMKIAAEAGEKIRRARPAEIQSKEGVGNFVTEYDVAVQRMVQERLHALCPEAAFLGEEEAAAHGSARGDCFVVDPIDGTQNFINGFRHSCISIGMLHDGVPVRGVVYDPYQDELFHAEAGRGAFVNDTPIHASRNTLADSVFLFGSSSYNRALAEPTFRLTRLLFDRTLDLRDSGSAALDLCYVAAGRCNVFFEYQLCPWDYCAGALILQEAGGRSARMDGAALEFLSGGSVLAAGPAAFEETLALAKTVPVR